MKAVNTISYSSMRKCMLQIYAQQFTSSSSAPHDRCPRVLSKRRGAERQPKTCTGILIRSSHTDIACPARSGGCVGCGPATICGVPRRLGRGSSESGVPIAARAEGARTTTAAAERAGASGGGKGAGACDGSSGVQVRKKHAQKNIGQRITPGCCRVLTSAGRARVPNGVVARNCAGLVYTWRSRTSSDLTK